MRERIDESGVLAIFDGSVSFAAAPLDNQQAVRSLDGLRIDASDRWSDTPAAEVRELDRQRPTAVAIAARRFGVSRFSVKRPLSFTFWVLAAWWRRRHDRRELRIATNLLFVAPDQVLQDIGVSRDEMLAKYMCRQHADQGLGESESNR